MDDQFFEFVELDSNGKYKFKSPKLQEEWEALAKRSQEREDAFIRLRAWAERGMTVFKNPGAKGWAGTYSIGSSASSLEETIWGWKDEFGHKMAELDNPTAIFWYSNIRLTAYPEYSLFTAGASIAFFHEKGVGSAIEKLLPQSTPGPFLWETHPHLNGEAERYEQNSILSRLQSAVSNSKEP